VSGAAWKRVVEALAASSDVFVTGFQTISGIASDFAGRLDYIRPNVRFLDGKNGTFSELLAGCGRRPCLTLFEMRRYAKLSLWLAEAAREAGLPSSFCATAIVTGRVTTASWFCPLARSPICSGTRKRHS
jgi:DNA-binding MurR/RpiR family transcriptional regulator